MQFNPLNTRNDAKGDKFSNDPGLPLFALFSVFSVFSGQCRFQFEPQMDTDGHGFTINSS